MVHEYWLNVTEIPTPSSGIVAHGHTPFCKRGKGFGNFFYSSLLWCSVQCWDQSQRSILSHECCYHNFIRKLQGVNQLWDHKQLLRQSFRDNYAALALVQCEWMKFLCKKWLQQKLPDPFPLLRNGVWPRKTTSGKQTLWIRYRWYISISILESPKYS